MEKKVFETMAAVYITQEVDTQLSYHLEFLQKMEKEWETRKDVNNYLASLNSNLSDLECSIFSWKKEVEKLINL